jgi:hypothetical protein
MFEKTLAKVVIPAMRKPSTIERTIAEWRQTDEARLECACTGTKFFRTMAVVSFGCWGR